MVQERLNPQSNASRGQPPPLESGDQLTRPEFEQRYTAATRVK